jgi:hypothetical protein
MVFMYDFLAQSIPLATHPSQLKVGETFYSLGMPEWLFQHFPSRFRNIGSRKEILEMFDLVDKEDVKTPTPRTTRVRRHGKGRRTISIGSGNGYMLAMDSNRQLRKLSPLNIWISILLLCPLIPVLTKEIGRL